MTQEKAIEGDVVQEEVIDGGVVEEEVIEREFAEEWVNICSIMWEGRVKRSMVNGTSPVTAEGHVPEDRATARN
ncbi:hypothetical protein [Streptomyces sp. NPDC006012]|uniref:hypothetical protein n=1 Tax=Streptomyces sp. NPDC006012 TaxID=3364739 RepID=UPI0036AE7B77